MSFSIPRRPVAVNEQKAELLAKPIVPATTSKWRIGWRIPTLMASCYILALILATVHLLVFLYLNGKIADGPNRVVQQSYITTASSIQANAFAYCLNISLGTTFIQYLWYKFRVSTFKVSTIETLFCVRSNPFLIFRPVVLRNAPVLFFLVLLMWSISFVTSFPVGALTIVSSSYSSSARGLVPTFNASFMGNGSGYDAEAYSLDFLVAGWNDSDVVSSASIQIQSYSTALQRLASQVLINGAPHVMPSPCGVNCSYELTFDGPYMQCINSSSNMSLNRFDPYFPIYTGSLGTIPSTSCDGRFHDNSGITHFNITTLVPLEVDMYANQSRSLIAMANNLSCVPFRAEYTIINSYENNNQKTTVRTMPTKPLINFSQNCTLQGPGTIVVPGFGARDSPLPIGIEPANWSDDALVWYRDLQIMALFDAMANSLSGSYLAPMTYGLNDSSPIKTDVVWLDMLRMENDFMNVTGGPLNGTIIVNTRFSSNYGRYQKYDLGTLPVLSFNITQHTLNEALANITLSAITAYGFWNTTTNVTLTKNINIYSFSRPANLIIPYYLSLLLALPFLFLGAFALRRNGVSAAVGGFTQLITTSTGSAILEKAAAGGCLGGDENVPQALKDLKIRFGELIDKGSEDGAVRRAGFGTEDETLPLTKDVRYGITL